MKTNTSIATETLATHFWAFYAALDTRDAKAASVAIREASGAIMVADYPLADVMLARMIADYRETFLA